MNATTRCLRSAALVALLLAAAGAAQAGYLCNAPPTLVHRRACEAAAQGQDALHRYIRIHYAHNLGFFDYVDEARLIAWAAEDERARRARETARTMAKTER